MSSHRSTTRSPTPGDASCRGRSSTRQPIADRFGVNPTDLTCLELLAGEAAMSPTRLAELSGLTTGAVTGVLDRLERAGIVRRAPDRDDRRRVAVRRPAGADGRAGRALRTLPDRRRGVAGDRPGAPMQTSPDALDRVIGTLEAETARLRASVRGGMVGDTFVAPTGAATRGRLTLQLRRRKARRPQGRPRAAGADGPRDARVPTPAGRPERRRELAPRTVPRRDPGRPDGDGARHDPVPETRRSTSGRERPRCASSRPSHGPSRSTAGSPTSTPISARSGLLSLELRGGANHVRLRLPRPEGTVRIMLAGGASEVRIDRPAGTAVSVSLRGAVSHLRFDGHRRAGADAGDRRSARRATPARRPDRDRAQRREPA